MSLASGIVRRPVLGLVIFALVATVALFLVSNIAIDMFPDMSSPYLMVNTTYGGAGPETVEKSVTRLLESQLVNVSGLKNITSTSGEGSSQISMEFEFGANLDDKVNDIRDRLDRVKTMLPDGADLPRIFQMDPNSMPILRIAVQGNRSVNELQAIASETIQDRLEQVDGVASTGVMGGVTQRVQVEISQNRLEAYGLTITGIAGSLASQNMEMGAGSIVDGSTSYSIRTTGEYGAIQDIAETVIARRGNADIRLVDIAQVKMGYPDETSAAYINGENGIFVTVTKQSGTNSVAVADKVYAKLDEIRAVLPSDIKLEIIQDNTTQVRNMISELLNTALMGAVLAMGILFLFLRNIKSTIIIGIAIPFSILVTLLMMNFSGLTLNMLTLAGLILGIGLTIDCSIVILENIFKFRERGTKPDIAAILGGQEVMTTIISATLTTLCVFIPIILFKNSLGFMGIMFQDLIITVGVSLAASLFVAIFLVPVLASKYLPLYTRTQRPLKNRVLKKIDDVIDGGIRNLTKGYTYLLSKAVKHRLLTAVLVIAVFVSSVIMLVKMRVVMMPMMNEDSVTLNVQFDQGTVYDDIKAVMLQIQDIVFEEIKGIKSVVTNITQLSSSTRASANSISITIDMNMNGADTSGQAMQKLRERAGDFPNVAFTFGRGMGAMFGGSDIDLALRINDIAPGLQTAKEIKELLEENIPELVEVSIDMDEGLPQVEIFIDRYRAYNLGLSVNSIAREISAAMNGVTATTFRYEGDEYSVVLELQKEDKEKVPDLNRIFVASNAGTLVPVSNFAQLDKGLGPVSVKRENQSRMIHITGTLDDRDKGRVFEIEQRIKELLETQHILPDGLFLTYEGQSGEITDTIKTFLSIIILAVLLVFGIMAGLYESFKDPFINLFTIPLMLIGVVAIYSITGQTISMFTLVGIVMLVGIVTNNGIILVDYTNLLVNRGVPVRQACIEAGGARLRPVLMTALTTIIGLIPLAFFPGKSAGFIQPIGLTVIGGLFSSTFITLLFIPVLYSLINERRSRKEEG
jgi:HAE1 family hydrophobic/amphiphilic exporter-1